MTSAEEGEASIFATDFFMLPDQGGARSRAFVSQLTAGGGGDEPESALEALALAIKSPWERSMDKRRHIVVVCTDASATCSETSAATADLEPRHAVYVG